VNEEDYRQQELDECRSRKIEHSLNLNFQFDEVGCKSLVCMPTPKQKEYIRFTREDEPAAMKIVLKLATHLGKSFREVLSLDEEELKGWLKYFEEKS
jgi:hypothetical protein